MGNSPDPFTNLPSRILQSSQFRWRIIQDHAAEWYALTGAEARRLLTPSALVHVLSGRESGVRLGEDRQ